MYKIWIFTFSASCNLQMSLMLKRGEILFPRRFYFSKESASSVILRLFSLRFRIFFVWKLFLLLWASVAVRGLSRDSEGELFSSGGARGVGVSRGAWALGARALAFVARGLSSCDPAVAGGFLTTYHRGSPRSRTWEKGDLPSLGQRSRLSVCPQCCDCGLACFLSCR